MFYPHFRAVCQDLEKRFQNAQQVRANRWQSVDVSDKPEMSTYELMDHMIQVQLTSEDLNHYRHDIYPNLPWADKHFELERVSGQPINPGTTWREWPWGHSAGNFLNGAGQFSHTYAERYWPHRGVGTAENSDTSEQPRMMGLRFHYGNLQDLVNLLVRDKTTRQAVLPVWFPEDTGVVHGERVPCTISYVFNQRNEYLHVFYHIRSCDYLRHFRDDCYLTVRLLLWVLEQARALDPSWNDIRPGRFTMVINSLHLFVNDYHKLFPPQS